MMSFSPRMLWLETEAERSRELVGIGAGADEALQVAASSATRLVRLRAVPPRLVVHLRQQLLPLGGEVVAARMATAPSDVVLVATPEKLSLLSQRLLAVAGSPAELAGELMVLLRHLERPPRELFGRSCRLSLERPLIMGVLNVTPDSFSDGGRYCKLDEALRRAETMMSEGADIIDIGGESTRPGAAVVGAEEETERVVPVIEALRRKLEIPLSIDTSKAAVARAAVAAGADFVNDVSGLHFDAEMAGAVAAGGAGLFLMHTRGRPDRMQHDTEYVDLLGEVIDHLRRGMIRAVAAGVPAAKLAVDPGIGFGKSLEGNLELLRRLPELQSLGRPVLLGTSRKGFIGRITGEADPTRRLPGTLATVALGVARGAQIFRVHDVAASRAAALTAWAVCRGEWPESN